MESRNIKININRKRITAEEIERQKNFSKVLSNYRKLKKPVFNNVILFSGLFALVITTFFIIFKSDFSKEKNLPFIHPSVSELSVIKDYYEIDNKTGGSFHHFTESEITIPEWAFVNNSNQPVKGRVKVSYREFHHIIDVIFSGIPMTYDSSSVKYNFETAGMLEILAFNDAGEPVYLRKDKRIKVKMTSLDSNSSFNLYYLDTLKKNWTYLGKDEIIKETPEEGGDLKKEIASPLINLEKELTKIKTELAFTKAAIPVKPQKVNPDRYKFNMDILPEEFPELAPYSGMYFEIGEENKNISPSLYQIEWEDASLSIGTPGKNFKLTLSKGKESCTLIVYPVFEGGDYNQAMKEYNTKYASYKRSLAKRGLEEERKQEEIKQLKNRLEQEHALSKVKEAESEAQQKFLKEKHAIAQRKWKEEQIKRSAEWKVRHEEFIQSPSLNVKVQRAFSIANLGIYNCDRPHLYPNGAIIAADFCDSLKNRLSLDKVWLVEKGKNAVYTYNSNNFSQFKFNPSARNILISIGPGNTILLHTPEAFSTVPTSGKHTFVLKEIDKQPESPEEIKKYLNL